MLSFFTALFGGAYLAGKVAKERRRERRVDREIETYFENLDNYKKLLCAPENFDDKVYHCISDNNYATTGVELGQSDYGIKRYIPASEIKRVLQRELISVLGADYEKVFSLPGTPYFNGRRKLITHELAHNLVLSCYGWLSRFITCGKFELEWGSEDELRAAVLVCKRIEENMRRYSRMPSFTLVHIRDEWLPEGRLAGTSIGILELDPLSNHKKIERLW